MGKKLFFKTGAMGSGKSLDMIRAIYNYKERGMNVLVYKPSLDTREGTNKCVIKSRTGFEVEGKWLPQGDNQNILTLIANDIIACGDIAAIFIDECQFLTEKQVDDLQMVCFVYNVPILCYGLLVDFQRHLFPGSKRLIEIADDVEELRGICHCGRRAKQNVRVINGKMAIDGDVVKIGGSNTEEKDEDIYYVAVCNKCYLSGKID